MSMTSLRTGYSGDTASLPSLMGPQNDWEIAPMDIEILRRDDGSPWELGAGAFGKVRALPPLSALKTQGASSRLMRCRRDGIGRVLPTGAHEHQC